jgi:ribosomal protein L11 methyltransferase
VALAVVDVPRAEALVTLAGAETLSLRDAADDPVFEPEPSTTPLWPNVVLEALFERHVDLAPLQEVLATAFSGAAVTVDVVDEAALAAKPQPVKARAIGTRLWLAPADDSDAPADRIVVRINMGLAFGTGEHATTALCLEWLERHVTPGLTVLDYGCGSGILALAALKLGARFVHAIDNDDQALMATRTNAALNGVADRVFVGAPQTLPAVTVDLVAANILARPLVELAPTFAQYAAPGSLLVLSGILQAQAAQVAAAYAPYFTDVAQESRDGWVRLSARRKQVNSGQNR